MKRKNIIKLINETISSKGFDFLDIESMEKEEINLNILNSYDFQKAFLYDLFFNDKKIKTNTSEATIRKETENDLMRGNFDLEYSTVVDYEYLNQKLSFEIMFEGEKVDFVIKESELDGRKKVFIDWDSIGYSFYNIDGDLIDFHIFEKLNDPRIERNFIKQFIGLFIETDIMV